MHSSTCPVYQTSRSSVSPYVHPFSSHVSLLVCCRCAGQPVYLTLSVHLIAHYTVNLTKRKTVNSHVNPIVSCLITPSIPSTARLSVRLQVSPLKSPCQSSSSPSACQPAHLHFSAFLSLFHSSIIRPSACPTVHLPGNFRPSIDLCILMSRCIRQPVPYVNQPIKLVVRQSVSQSINMSIHP